MNGWDHIIDNNRAKTAAAQLSYTPNDQTALFVNYIGGNEDPATMTGDSLNDMKQMIDITTYRWFGDNFKLGLNAAYGLYHLGETPNLPWWGTAIYTQYQFSPIFALGARYEHFDDHNEIQYLGTTYDGLTLTGVFTLADGHIYVKPEARIDTAGEAIYSHGQKWSRDQSTVGLSLVGRF